MQSFEKLFGCDYDVIAKFIKARYLLIIVKKSVTVVFQQFYQMRAYLKISQFDHITHRNKKR